jgi:hypothetical protein
MELNLYKMVSNSRYSHVIEFQELIISRIVLPETVLSAISEKLALEQRASSYVFRLQQERQEAERLRIEAIGIQNFYAIVSGALTENLLTWRGIEATVELSRSPNSKIVIVGSGKDQLPLILGSDIQNLPPAKPIDPVDPKDAESADWGKLPSIFQRPLPSSRGVRDSAPGTEGQPMPGTSAKPRPSSLSPPVPPVPAGSQRRPQVRTSKPDRALGAAPSADRSAQLEGMVPSVDQDGLRGEKPLAGFRILPRHMETPENTRAPYGAKSE